MDLDQTRTHRTSRLTTGVLATALGLAGAAASAAPAQAADPKVTNDHYSGSFSEEFSDCGYDLRVDVEYRGTFQERVAAGGALVIGKDRYDIDQTFTNLDTGRSFSTSAVGMFRQHKPVHLGGDLYEVISTDTGATFTVYDGDGRAVERNRGRVTLRFVLDTLGDDDPFTFDVVDFELVGAKGPFVEGGSFCGDVERFTA